MPLQAPQLTGSLLELLQAGQGVLGQIPEQRPGPPAGASMQGPALQDLAALYGLLGPQGQGQPEEQIRNAGLLSSATDEYGAGGVPVDPSQLPPGSTDPGVLGQLDSYIPPMYPGEALALLGDRPSDPSMMQPYPQSRSREEILSSLPSMSTQQAPQQAPSPDGYQDFGGFLYPQAGPQAQMPPDSTDPGVQGPMAAPPQTPEELAMMLSSADGEFPMGGPPTAEGGIPFPEPPLTPEELAAQQGLLSQPQGSGTIVPEAYQGVMTPGFDAAYNAQGTQQPPPIPAAMDPYAQELMDVYGADALEQRANQANQMATLQMISNFGNMMLNAGPGRQTEFANAAAGIIAPKVETEANRRAALVEAAEKRYGASDTERKSRLEQSKADETARHNQGTEAIQAGVLGESERAAKERAEIQRESNRIAEKNGQNTGPSLMWGHLQREADRLNALPENKDSQTSAADLYMKSSSRAPGWGSELGSRGSAGDEMERIMSLTDPTGTKENLRAFTPSGSDSKEYNAARDIVLQKQNLPGVQNLRPEIARVRSLHNYGLVENGTRDRDLLDAWQSFQPSESPEEWMAEFAKTHPHVPPEDLAQWAATFDYESDLAAFVKMPRLSSLVK